jgi:predicted phosphodiesterase
MLKYVRLADEVWHAGDIGNLAVTDAIQAIKPLRAVYGNIDNDKARMEFPLHNQFFCEDVSVWITHIGGYPGKYNPAIRAALAANPPQLFILLIRLLMLWKRWLFQPEPFAAAHQ